MSSILGWLGQSGADLSVLQRMAGACGLTDDPVTTSLNGDFAVAATGPALGGPIARVACSADGQTTVAFAGYLYDEDPDKNSAPAKLCLELYETHGTEFAGRLNGTFAVAIHDRSAGRLHLISDRLSTRALYYSAGSPFLFGSEIKAILEYPGVSRKPNPDKLRQFLAAGSVKGFVTCYDHTRQVPEASVFTWDGRESSVKRYWSPQFTWRQRNASTETLAQEIAAALKNSVRRICAGHQHPGLMLSGGLDSRAIAAASETPLACKTMHTARGLEVSLAGRVAQALGHPHEFIALEDTYPLPLLTVGSLIGDGVHDFHHAQSWLMASALRRDGLSMVFNGWGLDTLFSGCLLPNANSRGLRKLLPPALASAGLDPVEHMVSNIFPTAPADVLDAALRNCTYADVRADLVKTLSGIFEARRGFTDSAHDMIALTPLHNIAACPSALNFRSLGRLTGEGLPAFDNEVVEVFLGLPPAYRFDFSAYARAIEILNPAVARIPRSGTGLPIVRCQRDRALQHYRQAIEGRAAARLSKLFPQCHILDRSSWPPIGAAMVTSAKWHERLHQRLDESYLIDTGIMDGANLRRFVGEQMAGRANHTGLISTWLTLEEWFVKYQ